MSTSRDSGVTLGRRTIRAGVASPAIKRTRRGVRRIGSTQGRVLLTRGLTWAPGQPKTMRPKMPRLLSAAPIARVTQR